MAYSKTATWVVAQWNDDWKLFFEDVCAQTGLSLQDAMLFHSVLSQLKTAYLADKIADKIAGVSPVPPKEPWET